MPIEQFKQLKRRKFLKYIGLTTVGLAAATALPKVTDRPDQMQISVPVSMPVSAASPKPDLPEFQGVTTWLNSQALNLADLNNQVVLIHIWTFACINCQRTLPYVVRWHRDYAAKGLKVIGIHTPEFQFERDLGNVKKALKKHDITYANAIDNDFKMWKAYKNEYWPHLFLADRQGVQRYDHIGEGAYDETEQKIRELLG
jgi:thiol-disulfide isomerase/thioredoxin